MKHYVTTGKFSNLLTYHVIGLMHTHKVYCSHKASALWAQQW